KFEIAELVATKRNAGQVVALYEDARPTKVARKVGRLHHRRRPHRDVKPWNPRDTLAHSREQMVVSRQLVGARSSKAYRRHDRKCSVHCGVMPELWISCVHSATLADIVSRSAAGTAYFGS